MLIPYHKFDEYTEKLNNIAKTFLSTVSAEDLYERIYVNILIIIFKKKEDNYGYNNNYNYEG